MNNVPPNTNTTFTFENLPFETQFFIGGQSLARVFPDVNSPLVNYNVSATTGAQPKTATPSTAVGTATTNSVSFSIINNDANAGTASWSIVEGINTVASGSQFIGPAGDTQTRAITVSAFGLDPSTTYTLVNARVLADNKTISDPGTNRSLTTQALPLTATPSFESTSSTETSVSFRIRNNEAGQVSARYSINANPDGSSPTVTISSNGLSTTLTFSGLTGSTTYSVRADAIRTDGTKQRSNVASVNITTQAPPPPPYNIRARLDSTQFASTSVTHSLNSSSTSTTLNTSSFTTLYSNITGTNSFSITAPSSFTQSGTTFTFTRFIVNGVNQPLGQTTYSANVSAATDVLVVYGAFA